MISLEVSYQTLSCKLLKEYVRLVALTLKFMKIKRNLSYLALLIVILLEFQSYQLLYNFD